LISASSQVYDPVVDPCDGIPGDKSTYEPIREPDQASNKRHAIPYEELTEEREMWTYNIPTLEYEPVCSDEYHKPCHESGYDALNRRVQA
jgi:hypothetical protein